MNDSGTGKMDYWKFYGDLKGSEGAFKHTKYEIIKFWRNCDIKNVTSTASYIYALPICL